MPAERLSFDDVRGFVFDVDGTLAHRDAGGRAHPQPGAVEVLERIRASGRPLVLFTNGSHLAASAIARGLREDGIPVGDDEVLDAGRERAHATWPATTPGSAPSSSSPSPIRERMASAGVAGDRRR